jgi:hypothetical protein
MHTEPHLDISRESVADSDRLTPLLDEQPPTSHLDAESREWRYWPLTSADQMWLEVVCNQSGCDHLAAFVGVTDVLRDGTLHYDSVSTWCYWCMPREALSPDAVDGALR